MEIKKEFTFYFEMHMCAYEKDDPESGLYMRWRGDAHKPLTEESLTCILNNFGKVVCKLANFDKDKLVVKFISKEEYEVNTADENKYNTFTQKWSENEDVCDE